MKKNIAILLFIFCLINSSYALPPLEELSYTHGDVKTTIYGCFTKPCSFQPGMNHLFYSTSQMVSTRSQLKSDAFNFMGRSGEKTFEIQNIYESRARSVQRETRLFHFVFIPNDLYYIGVAGGYPGCTPEDLIYLKMIELKNNSLTCQIILPDCMKKKN